MKKQSLFICAMLLTANAVTAQNTYFATDFTDGIPEGFTLHDVDGRTPSTDMQNLGFEVGVPWIVTDEGDDGNKVACSTSWYKNAGQSDDWMVTGAISIESADAVLSWRSRASDKDYRDGYKVYLSETGTSPEDFDKSVPLFSVSKETFAWTEHSVSLAAYEGKTIYLAFVNDSKDKTCLYIDDIFVGVASSVGIELGFGRVVNTYGEMAFSGKVFAAGKDKVTGYTIGYEIDGERYEQTYASELEPGMKFDFTLDKKFDIDRNETLDYKAWVKSGADSTGVSGRVSAYPWKIVAEEITGTWCGWCVRGIVSMEKMNTNYPGSFIGIAVHGDSYDPMRIGVEDYLSGLMDNFGMGGFPNCVVNRNVLTAGDPANIEMYYTRIREAEKNNNGVMVTAEYDAATDEINVHTDMYFSEKVENADYRLAYVLIEDDVHVSSDDPGISEDQIVAYSQVNYYAGGGNGEMGGFEDKPSVIPADQMWYNDVARGIYPDLKGEGGILPETVEEGELYTHNTVLSFPENVVRRENVSVAVLLLDKNGLVANADKTEIKGVTSGIDIVDGAVETSTDDAFYTLGGVRVSNPAKGVYIQNGRKIVF